MNEACPRSCGICQPLKKEDADNVTGAEKDDEGRDVCRDEVLECAGFAADGECLINPDCEFNILFRGRGLAYYLTLFAQTTLLLYTLLKICVEITASTHAGFVSILEKMRL